MLPSIFHVLDIAAKWLQPLQRAQSVRWLTSILLAFLIYLLAVSGHALLWLSLVKWKRKTRESARL
jgi:hypothetical protein